MSGRKTRESEKDKDKKEKANVTSRLTIEVSQNPRRGARSQEAERIHYQRRKAISPPTIPSHCPKVSAWCEEAYPHTCTVVVERWLVTSPHMPNRLQTTRLTVI